MNMKIGDLIINLKANVEQFEKGLTKSKTSIKGMNGNFGTLGGMVSRLGPLMAGAFATKKIVDFSRAVIDGVDNTAKLANAIGVTYNQMRKLNLVSDLSGVSVEDLSKSIQKMMMNLADGKLDNLQKLNIDPIELFSKNSAEQMEIIIQKLALIDNKGKRLKLSKDIFGKSGTRMADLAGTLATGVNNDVGAFVDTKQFENFNDELTISKARLEKVTVEMMNNLIPALTGLAKSVTFTIESFDLLGDSIDHIMGYKKTDTGYNNSAMGAYQDKQTKLGEMLRTGKIDKDTYNKEIKLAQDQMQSKEKAINFGNQEQILSGYGNVQSLLKTELTPQAQLDKDKADTKSLYEKGVLSKDQYDTALKNAEIKQNEINEKSAKENPFMIAFEEMKKDAESMAESVKTPLDKITDEYTKLEQLKSYNLIDEDTYNKKISQLNKEKTDYQSENDPLKNDKEKALSMLESAKSIDEKYADDMKELEELKKKNVLSKDEFNKLATKTTEEYNAAKSKDETKDDVNKSIEENMKLLDEFNNNELSMNQDRNIKRNSGLGGSGSMVDMMIGQVDYGKVLQQRQVELSVKIAEILQKIAENTRNNNGGAFAI